MEEFERKVKRLENSYREVKQENKGIKEYLFILSSVLAVVIILLIVAVQFTGHSIIDFSGGSLSNVVSETSFSHVAVGTDAPYSQTYGETGYGLVAYYSFDGDDMGGSLSAKDSYYSNYDGSYTGDAAVTSTGCVYGRCATFDGAGDYINLPNTGFPSGDGTISISAWVYPSGNDMAAVSLALASGDNNNRHLGVFTHQNNWFASHWGGDWDTGQAFTPNAWQLITYTYDGTSESFYYNGALVGSRAYASNYAKDRVWLGGWDDTVGNFYYLNGKLDEVMIFNHSLSADQVTAIYTNASNRFVSTQGNHTFTGINLGTNDTANITLGDYIISAGTSIQAQINDGEVGIFVDGVITDYSLSGDLGSATLKLIYNTDANRFFSPIAGESITIDAWVSVVADTTFPSISISSPTNTTYTSISLELNYTASDETALGSCWYSQDLGVTNVSFVGGCGNNASLTASEGSNTWTVWVNDTSNNVNSSSITFGVDTTAPTITVTSPGNITYNLSNSVTINFTSSDETAISSRWFYNGTGNTTYTDVVIQVLADGQYTFIFYTNDSSNNVNSTNVTFVVSTANTGLSSCLSQCTENEGCVINDACHLDSSMCSGSLCQFNNLTLSAQIKTGTDSSGNALNLNLNITSTASSPVLFLSGGAINFSGSAGSVGGNASIVNITVYNLFNTTNAFFYGTGGASSTSAKGGNGGILQINAHGIVRWFSDQLYGLSSNSPRLTGGASNEGTNGTTGTKTFNKDLSCTSSRFRDVDISDDGAVNSNEPALIAENYNNLLGEEGYVEAYDISCDDKLNVVELSRIGLNYNTR